MDDELVTISHRLTSKGISAIPKIFTSYYYEDEMGYKYEYRPVTLTTFAIEHQFFGEKPFVSHLINLLLYFICCCLFIVVLKQLFVGFNEIFILLTILIFIVHPLHTEAIASIKNRDEILALIFALLALYQSILFSIKGEIWRILLSVFFLILGLLSKSSSASFLVIIPSTSVLTHKIDFKRTGILLFSVSIVLLVYLVLKEYPLKWYIYFITATLTLLSSIIFIRKPDSLFIVIRKISPIGFPYNTPFVKSSFSEIKLYDILLYVFVISLCFFAFTKNNYMILLLPLVLLLYSTYWAKNYRFDLTLLVSFLLIFCMFTHHSIYALLFVFVYVVLIKDILGSASWKWYIPMGLITVAVYFKCYLNGSISSAHIILSYGLFYIAGEFIRWRHLKIALWIVAIIIHVYIAFRLNEFLYLRDIFIFIILLGFAISDLQISKRLKKKVLLIFSFFVLLAFIADITDKKEFDLHFVKVVNIKRKLNIIAQPILFSERTVNNKISVQQKETNVSVANKEDRPLDFVEFPLRFSPTLEDKIGTTAFVLGYYLKMMFLPYPMCFYYGYNKINVVPISNLWAILSVILHLLIGISGLYFIRIHPVYSIGVLAYLSSIFLFSNLASPVAGMIGDRLTFTASFGFCIAVGYGLSRLYEMFSFGKRKVFIGIFAIVIVAYSIFTISRNAQWKDHLTLYRHDIKYLEKSAQANNLLATRLVFESNKSKKTTDQEKLRREAIIYYHRSLEIYPSFFNAQYNLARTYELLREGENAIREYEKTIALDSLFISPYIQIALIYEAMNQPHKSIVYYQKLLEVSPNDFQVYNNLSALQFKIGNFSEAIKTNLKAVDRFPFAYEPVVNIGKTYFTMGDKKNALIYFEKAYKINSSDPNLSATIISICKEFGDFEKANYYIRLTKQ
ncbi:MAG: tetratricopeptide repeat protein [Bacteroidia bacterium]